MFVFFQRHCRACNKSGEPENLEVFDLSLPITNANETQTALDIFFGNTELDDTVCSICNKVGFLEEKHRLPEAPSVVVIHLKRFVFDRQKVHSQKDDKNVRFKMDIDLEPYALSPDKEEVSFEFI